jgi:REP element-mobilizing transposase RayT
MPNQPRGDYEGAWHHVHNRGVDRQPIFFDIEDRRTFLNYVASACERYEVEVHAYALMTNHFHFLMHSPGAGLGRTMQLAMSRFTKWFNHKYGRSGSLFGKSYSSDPLEDEAGILEVSRYVHNNPVEAHMVSDPADHPWSSQAAYDGAAPRPPWLHCEVLLAVYNNNRSRYGKFVREKSKKRATYNPNTPRATRLSGKFLAMLEAMRHGPGPPEALAS